MPQGDALQKLRHSRLGHSISDWTGVRKYASFASPNIFTQKLSFLFESASGVAVRFFQKNLCPLIRNLNRDANLSNSYVTCHHFMMDMNCPEPLPPCIMISYLLNHRNDRERLRSERSERLAKLEAENVCLGRLSEEMKRKLDKAQQLNSDLRAKLQMFKAEIGPKLQRQFAHALAGHTFQPLKDKK